MAAPRIAPDRSSLLAVDPGKDTGLAVFVDEELWWCCLVHEPPFAMPARAMVIEEPQAYRHSKAPPQSLIKLAEVVGQYQELARRCGSSVQLVKPREWKGQLPKDICAKRVLEQLTCEERSRTKAYLAKFAAGKQHNVLDAIGIGLFALGRFRPC